MTTYGDTLAGWLNGSRTDGSGLWAMLLLLVALLVLVGVTIILIRVVHAAVDGA